MKLRGVWAALVVALLLLPAANAAAETAIAGPGSGAGQVLVPQGVALSPDTGRLYVADRGNRRVDVFDSSGFLFAFGWGVLDGAQALQTCTSFCQQGLGGAGAGQFSNGIGDIAIDEDGNVLVADRGNGRISKFSPAGVFIFTIGGGVDETSGADICTAVSGDVCGPGSSGFGVGEFSGDSQLGLDDGPGAGIVVGDSKAINVLAGEFESRVQRFDSSGAPLNQCVLGSGSMAQLAVDSTGAFYVHTESSGQGLRKYDAACNLTGASFDSFNTGAVATDSGTDDLFVGQGAGGIPNFGSIAQYQPDGTAIRRFGYGSFLEGNSVKGLAPDVALEGVYAAEADRVIFIPFPPPGPVVYPSPCAAHAPVGNTKAILEAIVNPETEATTVHFDYVDDQAFQTGGFSNPATKSSPESSSIGSDIERHEVSAMVDVVPETIYHCRVVATNSKGQATGPAGQFETAPPFEASASASGVELESAFLNARVNPLGIPASGYFEYVDDADFKANGFSAAIHVPSGEELSFGSGNGPVVASVLLTDLSPNIRYHYRLRVFDSFLPAGRTTPAQTFHTPPLAPEIPDGRGYELVSPQQRNSAEVGVPGTPGGLFDGEFPRILAAAPSGEAVTYSSFTSFGADARSAPGASQYLSKRTASGWSTENITPFGFIAKPSRGAYNGFSPDLSFGAFLTTEPPLEGAVPEFANLYLRDNGSGQITAITTEEPQVTGADEFCPGYAGATADRQHLIFAANGALAGGKKGKGFSLYEWTPTAGVKLVSVLPGEVAAAPGEHGFGAARGGCSVGLANRSHAISADGSRIFWTFDRSGTDPSQPSMLFARIDGTETIQLDAPQGGLGTGGSGRYWGASVDGSKVIFTDVSPLTSGAGPASFADLYRYEFNRPSGEELQDLTPAAATPGPEPADVRGVLGASDDGSYIYFAANGVLAAGASPGTCSGEAPNGSGHCSLYLWHEGDGITYLATVSGEDAAAWSAQPTLQTARVSPDGLHLAFTSVQSLTGFDNTIEGGGGCKLVEGQLEGNPNCAEAFLYDAADATMTCASCNPTGSRPLGPTKLAVWSNPYEHPHQLSDSGSRLFFATLDALDRRDVNGKFDVYEFERVGAGGCSGASLAFDETSGGCTYLVSSGESDQDSYLIDTSADGRDVFFSTRQRLLPSRDRDERFDIYDFRAGGGFPEIEEPSVCGAASACRPPATSAPAPGSPATSDFAGPGNVRASKHHKKHRKHHHKKKHRHRRNGGQGR